MTFRISRSQRIVNHLDRTVLRMETDQGHFRDVRDQRSVSHQARSGDRQSYLLLTLCCRQLERITKCTDEPANCSD